MSRAIAITRTDLTAGELRAAAARSRDAQAARRMLAVALVLEGVDRKTAAETCGMDRQTLQGLGAPLQRGGARRAREPPGRIRGRIGSTPRRWPNWCRGWRPAPTRRRTGWCAGGGRTCSARIADRFGVELHERTVGKYLAALGYRRLSVRPRHPKTDPEAQEGV